MKKITYEDLIDLDKLLEQYQHIRTKTKNKRKICNFEIYLGSNIQNLLNTLKNKNWKHHGYNIFIIKEPKYRIIMSETLNDKIINHLVSNYVLDPLIEPLLINSNVATRKNKGTSYGLYLAKKYINKLKENYEDIYVLKIDIKKYFYNIDHTILLNKLRKIIKDDDLYKMVFKIVKSSDNNKINDDIKSLKIKLQKFLINSKIADKKIHLQNISDLPLYKKGKGLPIGNLSSQILAIYYLNDVDHFIKEKLKIKYFIRYMDDFIIFSHDRYYLKYCLTHIINEIKKLKLQINAKTNIYNLKHGVGFLGYRFILKNKKLIIRINNETKRRIKRKIKNLKIYDREKLKRVQASYKGYLQKSNCHIMHIIK